MQLAFGFSTMRCHMCTACVVWVMLAASDKQHALFDAWFPHWFWIVSSSLHVMLPSFWTRHWTCCAGLEAALQLAAQV